MPDFILNLKIKIGKDRLIDLAAKYGREDRRVLRYSQKLDKLIVEIQERMLAG